MNQRVEGLPDEEHHAEPDEQPDRASQPPETDLNSDSEREDLVESLAELATLFPKGPLFALDFDPKAIRPTLLSIIEELTDRTKGTPIPYKLRTKPRIAHMRAPSGSALELRTLQRIEKVATTGLKLMKMGDVLGWDKVHPDAITCCLMEILESSYERRRFLDHE